MGRTGLAVVAVLALAGVARADEIAVVGSHALSGTHAGRAFTGSLEVLPDASFRGVRVFADGAREPIAGEVRVSGKGLTLAFARGIAARLGEEARLARSYERADTDRELRFTWQAGGDRETIASPHRRESTLGAVVRLAKRPRTILEVLTGNHGIVDPRPGLEILRSAQPSPEEVVDAVGRGVKTILSLNGSLDESATWRHDDVAEPVNLRAFVEARVAHPFVSMSASRAPSDEELVAVFRVLLDDSKRPILLHCRGGADRTGIIAALYQVELLGWTKERARAEMRRHAWAARKGTEIQGAYLDLYRPGRLRALLGEAGVPIPERYRK